MQSCVGFGRFWTPEAPDWLTPSGFPQSKSQDVVDVLPYFRFQGTDFFGTKSSYSLAVQRLSNASMDQVAYQDANCPWL